MNIVNEYVHKLLCESDQKLDPLDMEFQKLMSLIDPNEGSEFEIRGLLSGITWEYVDPSDGSYSNGEVSDEDAHGYLCIEKEGDTWSWGSSFHSDSLDASSSGRGFETLDACVQDVREWASHVDSFEVIGIA